MSTDHHTPANPDSRELFKVRSTLVDAIERVERATGIVDLIRCTTSEGGRKLLDYDELADASVGHAAEAVEDMLRLALHDLHDASEKLNALHPAGVE